MKKQEIGLIGLGVMGKNFLLNLAEKGFSVYGYDIAADKIPRGTFDQKEQDILITGSLNDFLSGLSSPRRIVLLVPAGVVDNVIDELMPLLSKGDILVDAGNSHPLDTLRRMEKGQKEGIYLIGMGVSGGSYGARFGPSMMPGGDPVAYNKIKYFMEATAAKVNGEVCVRYLGKGPAGHFVKMVHNGIEYGIMQLISESYDILRKGLGIDNLKMHQIFSQWNRTKLNSYLIEITSDIFSRQEKDKSYTIDTILDMARQKGTGKWASQMAMDLGIPIPTIDIAVSMRNLSAFKTDRQKADKLLAGESHSINCDEDQFVDMLGNSLYLGILLTFTQGFELMQEADRHYKFGLNLSDVAAIWRGGCIIRSGLLENIREAYKEQHDLPNLLFDNQFAFQAGLNNCELREIIALAMDASIPVPGFMSVIGYFDAFRSARLPMNLIQAQRDYFGGHTYQRTGEEGFFHTNWEEADEKRQ